MRTDLYRFVEGATVHTFTSGNAEVTYNSETYIPVSMGRSDIVQIPELSKANLEVSITLNNAVALRWLNTIVDKDITLVMFKKIDAVVTTDWQGRMLNVRTDNKDVILTFESVFTSLRRPGARKRYQRTCPYALYGRGCNLSKASFGAAGTVTAIVGRTVLTIAEAALQADGFYLGGIIEDSTGALRFIIGHVGDQITLSRDLLGIEVSGAITIFPGCDRTRSDCKNTFNNLDNFGGFPFIPLKNPFAGISIV